MFAVIDFIESNESAQIAVSQDYFNKFSDKLYRAICSNAINNSTISLKAWYDKLLNELNRLRAGAVASSDIITKFNNCAV